MTVSRRLLSGWSSIYAGIGLVALAVCLLALLGFRSPASPGSLDDGVLRACALSYDMPLSNETPDEYSSRSGLYLDLAAEMARRRNATLETHFAVTAFYKRPVREGLLAKKCDAYFGLPRTEGPWFIREKVALTKSFMTIGYALALPNGVTVNGLEDLKGKTVAVQGGSPGAIAVSYVDGIDTHTYRFATPALKALEAGEVDAALVWGPKAGYYVKHVSPGAFTVRPTTLQWPVAIGVRAADRASMIPFLETLIDNTRPVVAELRESYGLPSGEPVEIQLRGVVAGDSDDDQDGTVTGDRGDTSSDASAHSLGDGATRGVGRSSAPAVEQTLLTHVPYADTSDDPDIERGQRLFNSTYGCAHCHGTNAEGATAGTDLRRLEERYGDEAEEIFLETVRKGRDGTAMPPWEAVISDDKIQDIKAFIFSIQVEE